MALVVVERELEGRPQLEAARALERAGAQGVRLLRAYVSRDLRHMVSLYEAGDLEMVRRLHDGAGLGYAHLWSATAVVEHAVTPPQGYVTVVAQRAMSPRVTVEQVRYAASDPKGCNERLRVFHVGALLSADGTRMCCTYYSPDVESVRVANRESGIPFERIWGAE